VNQLTDTDILEVLDRQTRDPKEDLERRRRRRTTFVPSGS